MKLSVKFLNNIGVSFHQLKFYLLFFAGLIIALIARSVFLDVYRAPILYSDDWTQTLEGSLINQTPWFNLERSRPLLYAPFTIQSSLFGDHIAAYYWFLFTLEALNCTLLFLILNQFPVMRRHGFSLAVALLFFIFPTDYTRMWLTSIQYESANFLFLCSCFLLLRYAKGASWLYLFSALILEGLFLGIYEGPWGLIWGWWLVLFFGFHRQLSPGRKIALGLPVLLALALIIWRILGQKMLGIETYGLDKLTTDPRILLSRLILGYEISLAWGWTTTLRSLIPWLSGNIEALVFIGSVVLASWLILALLSSKFQPRADDSEKVEGLQSWKLRIKPYVLLGCLALALIGAGYIAFLPIYMPSLMDTASRLNKSAIYGAALFLSSILMIGAQLFAKFRQQIPVLFWASFALFLWIGIATDIHVQKEHVLAWEEQKSIWRQLFSIAPDFRDNTVILLILPGREEDLNFQTWKRIPLAADWDAGSGIRVLYGNPSLLATVLYPDIGLPTEPQLTAGGIKSSEIPGLIPYSRVVAFLDDSGTLIRLDTLPPALVEASQNSVKLCEDCLLHQGLSVPLRKLVQ